MIVRVAKTHLLSFGSITVDTLTVSYDSFLFIGPCLGQWDWPKNSDPANGWDYSGHMSSSHQSTIVPSSID